MMTVFDTSISEALGSDMAQVGAMRVTGEGALPSLWRVTDLAVASIAAAGREVAALAGASEVQVDRRLASFWFDMTLRPEGWALPNIWDAVAGDYQAHDGWIRLHTNAPHHRDAALSVLRVGPDRDAVAQAVAAWDKSDLETAVVAAGGCAAAMYDLESWAAHPQGKAVAGDPLIAWENAGKIAPRPLDGLKGVRVLDLTRILAGPVATRFLAGFGAEVLRIDPLDWDEPAAEPEVTLGKRCAGLDLRTLGGKAHFLALLKEADVFVHGYRPCALDALGLDVETRRAIAPACIDVSLCAYGWTGPWAARRGFDSLVQMSSGIAAAGMAAQGAARPVPLPVQALDHATGYLMAASVVRALRHRAQSGVVRAAKLSLARTAHELILAGPQPATNDFAPEALNDLHDTPEQTVWGPARRVRFPMALDDAHPAWPYPAGPLKCATPAWL